MKKQLKIKSPNGRGLQMCGIMSVILATLVSFAYLMPEDSIATEPVQASATGTEPTVTSASVVNSSLELETTTAVHTTHTTPVRTLTSVLSTTTTTVFTSTTSTSTLTSATTTSSATSTTSSAVTTTSQSTTVSSEIQATSSTEPEITSESETCTSEIVLTTVSPEFIYRYDEESQNYNEYDGHIHDDDYDYNSDYDSESETTEISGEGTYLGTFRITHYCPCEQCCGEYTGLTSSGTVATAGRTVSASSQFDYGTQLEIDGIIYTVEDRGGFSEDTIDIFCDTHEEALEKGTYYTDVYILE